MDNTLKKIIYFTSPNPSTNFLRYKNYHLERDMFRLMSIVFNVESAIKFGHGDQLAKKEIEVVVSTETYSQWDVKAIERELEELINLVLVQNIKINIVKKNTNYKRWTRKIPFQGYDSLCLFSGGVDSTSGILTSAEKFENLAGFFVAHGDQTWTINTVNKLKQKIDSRIGIPIMTFHAPPMFSMGYSQLRGFLYITSAAIYANLSNSKRIIITECGPTMYQPRFSPFDSITMTTHPFVLKKAKEIIHLLLGRNIELIMPYENLTKSEVASLSPEPDLFLNTHSCISQRFGTNEGTCYGCTVRRVAFITAGLEDTHYEHNPLLNVRDNADNILNLARFSIDILTDYENMEDYMKENILTFKKERLFEKFALDFFSALHILKENKKPLISALDSYYENVVNALGKSVLESHIENVRNKSYRPDFKSKVM